jgi:trans-aconitate methyltransferase
MQLTEAIRLIDQKKSLFEATQKWADLGCGTGLFTHALAHLLPDGSVVHAVDTDQNALHHLPQLESVQITPHAFNFAQETWPFDGLDGVLMANSLHYVADQHAFIQQIQAYLCPAHLLIIIEYDRKNANPWVPYPITYEQLTALLTSLGYGSVSKLGEHPSRYGNGVIYAALAQS